MLPNSSTPVAHEHLMGTGVISLSADSDGRIRFYTRQNGSSVNLHSKGNISLGGFYVKIICGNEHHTLAPIERSDSDESLCRFGLGYVQYSGKLQLQDTQLTFSITTSGVPGAAYAISELEIKCTGKKTNEAELIICSDLTPSFRTPSSSSEAPFHFCKNAVSMFTDIDSSIGDYFLTGKDEVWQANAKDECLFLSKTITFSDSFTEKSTFIWGCRQDCTLDWAKNAHATADIKEVKRHWAERLNSQRPKAPELWMQEEGLWTLGQMMSFALWNGKTGNKVLGGRELLTCDHPADAPASENELRELLNTAFACSAIDPQLSAANLISASSQLDECGHFTRNNEYPKTERFDPKYERSDLEILYLLGWAENLKQLEFEFADRKYKVGSSTQTVWEIITTVIGCIRNHLGTGPRGLIRMLRGDSFNYLDNVGRRGLGESVTNTAMTACALPPIIEVARHRGEHHFADKLDQWHSELTFSCGELFDEWFPAAVTDDGEHVGSSQTDGRIFLDPQVWCIRARCGTSEQRQLALQNVLATGTDSTPPPVLFPPYSSCPPSPISRQIIRKNHLFNGGWNVRSLAWLVWTLREERKIEEAEKIWKAMTLRIRSTQTEAISLAQLQSSRWFDNPHSLQQQLPSVHAFSWIQFALRKLYS